MARCVEHACVEEFEGFTREELVGIILEQRDVIVALREEVEEVRLQTGGGGKERVAAPGNGSDRPSL